MKSTNKIRLAIADDHQVLLKGLKMLLAHQPEFVVEIEANNGQELIDKIDAAENKPDVCLLDIRMPIMDGLQALAHIKRRWPSVKVIMLSQHNHEHIIINCLRNGANGYLLKEANTDIIYDAIKEVHKNMFYYNEIVPGYVSKFDTIPKLNTDEISLITLCCEELTYKEIAEKMNTTQRRVELWKEKLFEKLHIQSRTGLVMYAVKNGYV
ncbi:MAG: response regulator transcription factor [Bacteroidetes bacterium]|nr:response regulator transcription factor [Bacteroidota bacterium]